MLFRGAWNDSVTNILPCLQPPVWLSFSPCWLPTNAICCEQRKPHVNGYAEVKLRNYDWEDGKVSN